MLTKHDLIWQIYNDKGYQDLCLAYNYKGKDEHKYFSQWLRYHDLIHMEQDKVIPEHPIKITPRQFLQQASHRTIAPHEIILDIDDKDIPHLPYYDEKCNDEYPLNKYMVYTFPTIRDKAEWVCRELDNRIKLSFSVTGEPENISYTCWWTGSKSYHITIYISKLQNLYKEVEFYKFDRVRVNKVNRLRKKIKDNITWYYGGDLQKTSDRVMISIENVKHYRSGQPKKQVWL